MSTLAQITSDIKEAMKAKDKVRLSVLRMMLSEIKYAQANVNVHQEMPEAEVLKIVGTYQKRLVKSLDDFPDAAKKAEIQGEVDIVAAYLPKKASEAEVTAAVDEILGGTEDRNFGILMKATLAKLGDAADGKMVSKVLKQKLG